MSRTPSMLIFNKKFSVVTQRGNSQIFCHRIANLRGNLYLEFLYQLNWHLNISKMAQSIKIIGCNYVT